MSIRIYFGGSCFENWTEGYRLTVTYSERAYADAEKHNGEWCAVGGDESIIAQLSDKQSLAYRYFASAAEIQSIWSNINRAECVLLDDDVAFPELFRFLLDERGYELEQAYEQSLTACADTLCDIDDSELAGLQPRTAALLPLLRELGENTVVCFHNSADEAYRAPLGAVRCGEKTELSAAILSGRAEEAYLQVWGDDYFEELLMEYDASIYYVNYTAPPEAMALEYAFKFVSDGKTYYLCADGSGHLGKMETQRTAGFRLTVYLPGFDTPRWLGKSIMYQIFPDRFGFTEDGTFERGIEYHKSLGRTPEVHKSLDEEVKYLPRPGEKDYMPDDFYGGNFKGIEQKLPYLKKLGISCIYLNPIVEARSNHRYDTADYMRPDPILGTVENFEQLAAEAEKLGIRMILDGVFSHTGADSIYFNKYGSYSSAGAYRSEESEYAKWYNFKEFPDNYRSWWGFKELPEVDEHDSGWQDYVITGADSVVKTWLRRGAAGWRLDVADELPDDVLALIRASAKAEKPDAPIIGEVWEDAVTKVSYGRRRNYALGYSLDSVMNYPLRIAIIDFVKGRTTAYELRDFLICQQMNYPAPMYYSLMNLLGSHDVDRIRSALATDTVIRSLSREEQLKLEFTNEALEKAVRLEMLCAAIQFALPGVPSIYYGDEQGMTGVCDPFNRAPFKTGRQELFEYYVNLTSKRIENTELSTGRALFLAPQSDVIVILRYNIGGKDALGDAAEEGAMLAAVNRGEDTVTVTADCTAAGKGKIELMLPPLTAEMIKL